ncbi:MAG: cyclic pyranopterin monophosphate synthase MoaC [Myxococcales bacterium]|nr:cyclic pyranopterin monophosphate synthase MoaC [Myxococcales bacterium]
MAGFSHIRSDGSAHIIDVGQKTLTHRIAIAEAFVRIGAETLEHLRRSTLKKGDALAVARIGGLSGLKKTADLLPLAHPMSISHATVDLEIQVDGIRIETRVETTGPTGVEMEALTAASVAALNLYDMIKAHERGASIERVQLLEKRGGRSGAWRRNPDGESAGG